MLILERELDDTIVIGPDITIKVLKIGERKVKIGIDAPKGITVYRGEIARENGRSLIVGGRR